MAFVVSWFQVKAPRNRLIAAFLKFSDPALKLNLIDGQNHYGGGPDLGGQECQRVCQGFNPALSLPACHKKPYPLAGKSPP
jgi:hypothetical protein